MGSRRPIRWSNRITPSQVAFMMKAERDVDKAVTIFEAATAEYSNFRHNYTTFRLMMFRLLSVNRFQSAEEILSRMKEEGCEVKEDLYLMFCRAYGRVHKPLEAVRVLKKMREVGCEVTDRGYVTMLSILVDEGLMKLALRFYRWMNEMGVARSVVSVNVLVKGLCKSVETVDGAVKIFREMGRRGCVPDEYTYGTLINGMCRLGRLEEAKELFVEMRVKGVKPSVVTYTCVIHGLCIAGCLEEAVGLFSAMVRKGIEPNVFTYSSLMNGLCNGGYSVKALHLLHIMDRRRVQPNMVTYSCLIYGLCREKMLPKAVEIFDRMKVQGLTPDAWLCEKIIIMFFESGKFQEAADFLDEMILSGITPNRLTGSIHVRVNNMVVHGLVAGGDKDRAFLLYQSMRTRGILVDPMTFDFFREKLIPV